VHCRSRNEKDSKKFKNQITARVIVPQTTRGRDGVFLITHAELQLGNLNKTGAHK